LLPVMRARGWGRTNESAAAEEYRLRGRSGRAARRGGGQIPAGRVGTPGEYGSMGAFLASDKAGYITGSMIRVDGGRIRGMV
jgi:NAD(P)-dependent dehydrogenase (short-subunit alcohol dehydrogenase family)